MVLSIVNPQKPTAEECRDRALDLYERIKAWPHWEEVYLNCVKESPMSYDAFAQAVANGDSSRRTFERAMQASQMTREQFCLFLPAFQQFITLCAFYENIGMLSDGADQVWHAFMLITDRYGRFCLEVVGQMIDHLPCSLYELYSVTSPQVSSCISKCVPSTCEGKGGGCTKSHRDTSDQATIAKGIEMSRVAFVQAYYDVFQNAPDINIWNQLAN